ERDRREAGVTCVDAASVLRRQGRLQEAAELLVQAEGHFERCGARSGMAIARHDAADLQRLRGDLAGAEAGFRAALAAFRLLQPGREAIARLNLGQVVLARGRA